jgi:hypothetical protein
MAMNRIKTIQHKGKTIISLDFSNLPKEEFVKMVKEVMDFMGRQQPGSCLTLSNLANVRFEAESVKAIKELAEFDKLYVKAGALLGIEGLQKVAYASVMIFSKRKMPIFDTLEQAMDWLVEQD